MYSTQVQELNVKIFRKGELNMKFKRKIAALLAALMVLTLGSVTALADT